MPIELCWLTFKIWVRSLIAYWVSLPLVEVSGSSLKVRIYAYSLGQDEPAKCTSNKLCRFGYARRIVRVRQIPWKAVLLNPFAAKVLTSADRGYAERWGMVVVDCSWERVREVKWGRLRGIHRRLPLLLASNPVSYGKLARLSSIEALAASLYILGFKEDAERILRLYKWGEGFLKLNLEPLEAYRKALTTKDIEKIEAEYFSCSIRHIP